MRSASEFAGHLIPGLILCLFCTSSFAASLTAGLDRTSVESGQSVTLTVTARDLDGEIDFSVLAKDFDILDTSRSKNVQIINGKTDASLTWRIGLMPKGIGTLTIPSFAIGSTHSTAVELVVKAVDPQNAARQGRDYFVEVEVDNEQPFVQQQVVMTVQVHMANSIIEGSLGAPDVKDAQVERLGKDTNYTTILNERQYQVTERRYAIFPQQSGTFEIPPLRLEAVIRERDSGGSRGLFSPTRKLRLDSNGVTLNVRPKPAASRSAWWLPAETLSLSANWTDDPAKARVDEPITRSINLSVKGLHSTQLPTLTPPEILHAKVYPDQADVRNDVLSDSVVSYRTDKWVIIPRKAGPLELPEIRLEWYDTIKNQIRSAVVPVETIDVQPALSTEKVPTPERKGLTTPSEAIDAGKSPVLVNEMQSTTANPVVLDETVQTTFVWWPWITALAVAGWLVTLVMWRLSARGKILHTPKPRSVNTSRIASFVALEQACAKRDPREISQAALNWAAQQWPLRPPRSLVGLAEKMRSEGLHELFARLDAALYSKTQESFDCGDLVAQLREAIRKDQREAGTGQKENLLPNL